MRLLDERGQIRKSITEPWSVFTNELSALDPETATSDDIKSIVGVKWVSELECEECGRETWKIVEFGGKSEACDPPVYVCAECLRAALKLLGE